MLRILGRKTSGNVQKVLFLAEELGLEYDREDYGRQFENTQTEDYLALNPNAKVPTLIDGDLVIWESNTILRYLASKAGSQLYPTDPAARTNVERWMDWQLGALNPLYMTLFKGSRLEASERGDDFSAAAKEIVPQLGILDAQLTRHEYLAGDALSLAEFCLAPLTTRCLNFPIDLPDLTHLRAWQDRIGAMASFQAATAK